MTREEYYNKKQIIIITQDDLIFFNELSENWIIQIDSSDHNTEEHLELDMESRMKMAAFDPRTKSILNLCRKARSIPFSSLTSFSVEDNGIPIGLLKVGK